MQGGVVYMLRKYKVKNFKKKLLTDNNGNVIINELSLRQQKRILKSC